MFLGCFRKSFLLRTIDKTALTAASEVPGYNAFESVLKPRSLTSGTAFGWIPRESSLSQWIQVAFPGLMRIENIATAGLEQAEAWIKTYRLSHSLNGVDFTLLQNEYGYPEDLWGNKNAAAFSMTRVMFNATHVRLWPQTWQQRIALRWELFGCPVGKVPLSNPKPWMITWDICQPPAEQSAVFYRKIPQFWFYALLSHVSGYSLESPY